MEPTNAKIMEKLDSLLTMFERLDDRYRLLVGKDLRPGETTEIEGEAAYREDRLEPEPAKPSPFPFGSEDFHHTVFLVALHGLLTAGRGNEPAFYPARAKQIADAAVRAYE
jgi:hypothetical protein